MAEGKLVLARHTAGDRLHCYVVEGPIRPGDAILDPAGAVAYVVAVEEQLLGPAPSVEGQARPAPPAGERALSAEQALTRLPPVPCLNSIVGSTRGPARLLRIRVRTRTAVLSLAAGAGDEPPFEQPLSELSWTEDEALPFPEGSAAPEGSPPC